MIGKSCCPDPANYIASSGADSLTCAQLLLYLNEEDVLTIMTLEWFSVVHLEQCAVIAIRTILRRKNITAVHSHYAPPSIAPPTNPECLLRCTVLFLIKHIRKHLTSDDESKPIAKETRRGQLICDRKEEELPYLGRTLLWLLVFRDQLPIEIQLSEEQKKTIAAFCYQQLQIVTESGLSFIALATQCALDCCSLVSMSL